MDSQAGAVMEKLLPIQQCYSKVFFFLNSFISCFYFGFKISTEIMKTLYSFVIMVTIIYFKNDNICNKANTCKSLARLSFKMI